MPASPRRRVRAFILGVLSVALSFVPMLQPTVAYASTTSVYAGSALEPALSNFPGQTYVNFVGVSCFVVVIAQ